MTSQRTIEWIGIWSTVCNRKGSTNINWSLYDLCRKSQIVCQSLTRFWYLEFESILVVIREVPTSWMKLEWPSFSYSCSIDEDFFICQLEHSSLSKCPMACEFVPSMMSHHQEHELTPVCNVNDFMMHMLGVSDVSSFQWVWRLYLEPTTCLCRASWTCRVIDSWRWMFVVHVERQ